MFTGIVEEIGRLKQVTRDKKNLILTIKASFVKELKINQSVSHNGICLTVFEIHDEDYYVCAVNETSKNTTLQSLKPGSLINLERCLAINSRLDGHFVQGHIDCIAKCLKISSNEGSWIFKFQYAKKYANYLVKKGSIAINGVSLTIANIIDYEKAFEVAIIPQTFNQTNFQELKKGDYVNVEFDIIGKQIVRLNTKK